MLILWKKSYEILNSISTTGYQSVLMTIKHLSVLPHTYFTTFLTLHSTRWFNAHLNTEKIQNIAVWNLTQNILRVGGGLCLSSCPLVGQVWTVAKLQSHSNCSDMTLGQLQILILKLICLFFWLFQGAKKIIDTT